MSALAIERLTMRFGGLTAVDDLSLEVAAGSIHALIGPNGAGKSTLFNCITGFYRPSGGAIRFEDQDLLRLPRHGMVAAGIARTFQNLELFAKLSVLDNVRVGLHARLLRGTRAERRADLAFADEVIAELGLEPFRDTAAGSLDFGRQKTVEIARALAARPRLLLLDEPAAGLRNQAIAQLDRLLVRLSRERGITVVLVEHVMQLVMAISDRITVINFGRKIAEGSRDEVRRDPEVIAAYLGRRNAGA